MRRDKREKTAQLAKKKKNCFPQRGNTGGRVNLELTQASGQYQTRDKDEHG